MVLIDRSLSLERFDYRRIGDDGAILRLLAALQGPLGSPPGAYLVVEQAAGDELFYAPIHTSAFERRLLGSTPTASELLWQATFALPLDVVEAPRALFKLMAGSEATVDLPAPWLRELDPRPLALARARRREAPRLVVASRRQLAALASAIAVTGTTGPAIALAAGTSGTSGSARAPRAGGTGRSGYALIAPRTKVPRAGARAASGQGTGSGGQPVTRTTPTTAATTPTTSTTPKTAPTPATTTPTPATTSTTPVTTPTAASTTTTAVAAPSTTPNAAAPTTSPTPVAAPVTRTTRPRPHRLTTPARTCHAHTRGDRLVIVSQVSTGRVKNGIGLSNGQPAPNCTPTSAPKHHPTSTPGSHPKHHPTSTPGTHPKQTSHRHPGTDHPARHDHRAPRISGGAPLTAPKQPDQTLAPTPGSSTPSSGGAGEQPVPTLSSSPSFVNPRSWTGTVSADPSLTGAVRNLAGLLANGNRPPSFLIPIYMQAGQRYDIPWPVLAAINAVESDYGRDLSTSSAGALGWMQFEPGTWREYGVSADGHHNPNPYDPRDAIFAAARYLKAAGGSQDIAKAVFAYNHAGWYVDMVMTRAHAIAHQAQYLRAKVNQHGTYSVYFATGLKKHPTIGYTGGVLSHYDRLIASANMVSAANFPYLYGGGHEQPASWGPFDCSGSVSYVMQQAGYKVPTTVSGDIPSWKFPSGPGAVTIFYNPVHTFMRIGNRYFGTSGFARPGGGAGWFDVSKLPAGYLATFREVHVPRLGINSFAPNAHYIWPKPHRRFELPLGLPRTKFRADQR